MSGINTAKITATKSTFQCNLQAKTLIGGRDVDSVRIVSVKKITSVPKVVEADTTVYKIPGGKAISLSEKSLVTVLGEITHDGKDYYYLSGYNLGSYKFVEQSKVKEAIRQPNSVFIWPHIYIDFEFAP